MSYSSEVLADSPTIYLPFDTSDLSVNSGSRSISVIGSAGVTKDVPGIIVDSIQFAGPTVPSYINYNIGTHDYFNDGTWSVEVWFKKTTAGDTAYMELFNTYDANNNNAVTLYGSDNTGKLALWYHFNGSGNPTIKITGPVINDTNWHHVVATSNGTNVRLYLDNVEVGTAGAASTANFTSTTTLWVGAYGTTSNNENFKGNLDEFAWYPTALSTTRIAAHYNASITNAGYTAQAMTASAEMGPDALAATHDAVVATAWAVVDSGATGSNSNTETGTVELMTAGGGKEIYIELASLGIPSTAIIGRAILDVAMTNVGTSPRTVGAKKITSSFDASTVTYATKPTVDSVVQSEVTSTGTATVPSAKSFNVTEILKAVHAGTAYGIALIASASTMEFATPDSDNSPAGQTTPVLTVTYYDSGNRIVTVDVSTASALMPDPTVSTAVGVSVSGQPMTASGLVVDPVLTTTRNIDYGAQPMLGSALMTDVFVDTPDQTVFVEPFYANADMPQGSGFSTPVSIATGVATASALMVDAVADGELNGLYQAQPMIASAIMVAPSEGQGEDTDPYFIRLASQLGDEDSSSVGGLAWYRIDETEGTTVVNRVGADGIYRGAPTFGGFGPEGRRVVGFDGENDYIGIAENDTLTQQIRIEMVIKTDKENQILLRGLDFIFNNTAGGVNVNGGQGLDMINGRIRMYNMPLTATGAFTGRTYLADDEWHYITLKIAGQGTMEIYIDGKLEMRRFQSFTRFSIPDAFGGGPSFVEGAAVGPDDASQYFRGELMELVIDPTSNFLSERDMQLNYYAAFGIVPVEAGPMTASAAMGDARGKGNQKKALGLFYALETDENLDVPNYNDIYNWSGLRTSDSSFGIQRLSNFGSPSFDMAGYKVHPKSIIIDEYADSGYVYDYFNEVTGEQEFINLAEDIDMGDYDLVFFINLPPRFEALNPNGTERTITFNGRFDAMWERMMDGIRDAQDEHGFSIWAPQPEVALGLGIIDDYDVHSMLRETNPRGPITPFGQPGNGDFDTRALNKERVVATVTGLTDFGGWILRDYIFGFGPTGGANYQPPNEAWDYVERPDGLLIGDEIFYAQDFYDAYGSASWFSGGAHNQRQTVISVPADSVLAGTVVTRENLNHYVGNELVENPWKDNAVSIVVNPGDPVKGSPVNGKIYVNFMDSIDGRTPEFKKQIVPPNENIPLPSEWETPEMREWEYSSTRVSRVGQSVSGATVNVGDPQVPSNPGDAGAWAAYQFQLTLANLQRSGSIIVVTENEKYPTTYLEHYPMIQRAFSWLQDREEIAEGDKVIRPTAMTAEAVMPEVVATGQRDVAFTAEAAVANATMVNPDEVVDPDAVILSLPMTAFAEITGYTKIVKADPMLATAEMVEDFDVVHAGGEQVVLYLHYTDAIVYLKEDI